MLTARFTKIRWLARATSTSAWRHYNDVIDIVPRLIVALIRMNLHGRFARNSLVCLWPIRLSLSLSAVLKKCFNLSRVSIFVKWSANETFFFVCGFNHAGVCAILLLLVLLLIFRAGMRLKCHQIFKSRRKIASPFVTTHFFRKLIITATIIHFILITWNLQVSFFYESLFKMQNFLIKLHEKRDVNYCKYNFFTSDTRMFY